MCPDPMGNFTWSEYTTLKLCTSETSIKVVRKYSPLIHWHLDEEVVLDLSFERGLNDIYWRDSIHYAVSMGWADYFLGETKILFVTCASKVDDWQTDHVRPQFYAYVCRHTEYECKSHVISDSTAN